MSWRTAIYIPALIAVPVLLLAVLLLVADKDAVLKRVETSSGVATFGNAEDGVEDVPDGTLLVATLVLTVAGAEYQSFTTELL